MRAERGVLTAVALAAALCAAAGAAGVARAQDDDHDHDVGPGEPDPHGGKGVSTLGELPPAQQALAKDAWAHVMCACERENWSRTLANCPDGCADRQKLEILGRVSEGWTLQQIVDEQVKSYGPKASADPGGSQNGTLLVLAGIVVGAAAAGTVLVRWRQAASERRTAAASEEARDGASRAEIAAVEQELREID